MSRHSILVLSLYEEDYMYATFEHLMSSMRAVATVKLEMWAIAKHGINESELRTVHITKYEFAGNSISHTTKDIHHRGCQGNETSYEWASSLQTSITLELSSWLRRRANPRRLLAEVGEPVKRKVSDQEATEKTEKKARHDSELTK
ncbi:hypothetical protein C8R42DRAFT_643100 [Lentinula raphanica]|nr:hypothetical protein C8R42DRAFT_643100 [Lentinula raphanica]